MLIQNRCEILQNALLAALTPPVVLSYPILIQNRCKRLFWMPCQWLLIQSLFKIDGKCSPGCIASSCFLLWWCLIQFLLELLENDLLTTLPPPVERSGTPNP